MNEALNKISRIKLLPVIKIDNLENAVPIVKALSDGGIAAAEITFRTECAADAIKKVSSEMPEIFVGAGTVLSVENVKRAVDSGAKFIVSPGLNPEVVSYCVKNDIPIVPGCVTPTEIELAMSLGLDTVKFFPAEAYGGLKVIKALSAPYSMIKFIPTGGIDLSNIKEYLSNKSVLAVGGSFMVKDEFIKKREFYKITELTQCACDIIKEI